jgi:hypothetical protein
MQVQKVGGRYITGVGKSARYLTDDEVRAYLATPVNGEVVERDSDKPRRGRKPKDVPEEG